MRGWRHEGSGLRGNAAWRIDLNGNLDAGECDRDLRRPSS